MRVHRAQARHPWQSHLRDGLRRCRRRRRLPGRRGKSRPGIHVHDDEFRAARSRHRRRGDRGACLPACAGICAQPGAGQGNRRQERRKGQHHPSPGRAPHADEHEGTDRSHARAGHAGVGPPRQGVAASGPGRTREEPGHVRPADAGGQRLVHRAIHRNRLDRRASPRRHGFRRGNRCGAVPARCAHHDDLRGNHRHPANDLVGRKVAYEKGATIRLVLEQMRGLDAELAKAGHPG